jgi:hypothetical protein
MHERTQVDGYCHKQERIRKMKVWDGIGVLGMVDTLGPPLKAVISRVRVHSETRQLKAAGFSDIKDSRMAPLEI